MATQLGQSGPAFSTSLSGAERTFLAAWEGLKRIHSMKITHGDIYEENISLPKKGSFAFTDWEASSYGFASTLLNLRTNKGTFQEPRSVCIQDDEIAL